MLLEQLLEELKQEKGSTTRLINRILYSKRLLVDHVEALEQCLSPLDISPDNSDGIAANTIKTEKFTGRNGFVILSATFLEYIVTPKCFKKTLIPSLLVAGGFGAFYLVKKAFNFRNKIVECELNNIIRTIDDFGNCIRRNITYFNEILVMKQHELMESRQIERAWDCITAAKEVTEILYDATRKFETQYTLPSKYLRYYIPLEELRECEYFKNNVTDYTPQQIKDFYKIFSYVQSQFLLCLALIISIKPSINKINIELIKINSLIKQLVNEEENHFRNINIDLNKKQNLELQSLNVSKSMKNFKGPITGLQESSLKLSACMVAVASECQLLDQSLQQLNEIEIERRDYTKHLFQVANNMHSIENALSICFDDFQRLVLVYNKFLNTKIYVRESNLQANDNKSNSTDNEFSESILRVEISQNEKDINQKDDFYAYMYDEEKEPEKAEQVPTEKEILNFEKRIAKGKFQPVLKQLKKEIDPIRIRMLEKERQVLFAKGIDVNEFLKTDTGIAMDNSNIKYSSEESSNESDDSTEFAYKKRLKKIKKNDNFNEMRNFLAQKTAINIFNLENQPKRLIDLGNEDILESEI